MKESETVKHKSTRENQGSLKVKVKAKSDAINGNGLIRTIQPKSYRAILSSDLKRMERRFWSSFERRAAKYKKHLSCFLPGYDNNLMIKLLSVDSKAHTSKGIIPKGHRTATIFQKIRYHADSTHFE